MALPSLIVFGSQTTWPSHQYLLQLRAVLLLDPRLHTFINAVKELQNLWQILVKSDPRLNKVPGLKSLNKIQQWIDHGEFPLMSEVLPNVLCAPFTIIIHIVQYFHYLDSNKCGLTHSQVL